MAHCDSSSEFLHLVNKIKAHSNTIQKSSKILKLVKLNFKGNPWLINYFNAKGVGNSTTIFTIFFLSSNQISSSLKPRFFKIAFSTVWKSRKFTIMLFWQKIRENVFIRNICKELISRNIFSVRVNFIFFHTVILHTFLLVPTIDFKVKH